MKKGLRMDINKIKVIKEHLKDIAIYFDRIRLIKNSLSNLCVKTLKNNNKLFNKRK